MVRIVPTEVTTLPEQLASRLLAQSSDFKALIDIAPVMVWVAAPDGACTYLSKSWLSFTGQNGDEGLGAGWLHAIHPDDWTSVQSAFSAALAEKRSYQTEYRVKTAAGAYRWVLDSASPIIRSDGQVQGYIGSIVDNEERKIAELQRAKTERRLQIALKASAIGTWEWDIIENRFAFSSRALEIFGFEDGAVTYERLQGCILPEDLREVQHLSALALDPAVRANTPYRYRIRRESDQQVRWIEAHGEALFAQRDGSQQAHAYIGTFLDISESMEQERQAREAAARLELALEAAELAVWELDITTDRLSPSPALNKLYGFDADAEPTTDEFRARYAPGERERLEQLALEARARGEDRIRAEVKHLMPDGSVRWLLIQAQSAAPLPGAGPRAIGVVMDITERKLHEERLSVAAREMEHRVKNSLALVQSLVQQSFRRDRPFDEAKAIFDQRLRAYVEVTELISGRNDQEAGVWDLLTRALKPFRENDIDHFVLEGPDISVPAKVAFGLGLALHELATNSVKYGALSVPRGRVHISWTHAGGDFQLDWKEIGGPPVKPPTRRGFGSRLLGGAVLTNGKGTADLEFHPSGVHFHLIVPQP